MPEQLFSGSPLPFGGLSNELELAKACPPEFRKLNPWSAYADRLFFAGADISNWQWTSSNPDVRSKQLACLRGLLGTFELSHDDKEAVSGWMLSQMLAAVPEHLPPQRRAEKAS